MKTAQCVWCLGLAAGSVLSGCGTLQDTMFPEIVNAKEVRQGQQPVFKENARVYGGTRRDFEILDDLDGGEQQDKILPLVRQAAQACLFVDLPLSAVADTCMLPITVAVLVAREHPQEPSKDDSTLK